MTGATERNGTPETRPPALWTPPVVAVVLSASAPLVAEVTAAGGRFAVVGAT